MECVPRKIKVPKEVPKEVLFCSAIARGDAQAAKELLPDTDLFQKNNFGVSHAVFCLWAARQKDPTIALRILQTYYPEAFSSETLSATNGKANIEATLFQVLKAEDHAALLKTLLINISEMAFTRSQNQAMVNTFCYAAIGFILEKGIPSNTDPQTRASIQKMYDLLRPYVSGGSQFAGRTEEKVKASDLPGCMQKLMTVLNKEAPQAEAELLLPPHADDYLPKNNNQRVAQLTQQITQSIEESFLEEVGEKNTNNNVVLDYLDLSIKAH